MAQERDSVAYTKLANEPNGENENVPFYSDITFRWLSETLRLGYKRPLELPDLPYSMGQELTKETATEFETTWSCEINNSLAENRPPKLWTTVVRSIGYWNLTLVFFTATVAGVSRVIQQVLLLLLLTLMTDGTHGGTLWLVTIGFIFSLVVEMVAKNQYFYISQQALRTKITSGLIALVYQKLLSKRSSELADTTTGHVINLISKDLQPLRNAADLIPISIVGCLEFIAMAAVLGYCTNWLALTGMFYLVLISFCQCGASSTISSLRAETQTRADHRIAITRNVISGIRAVKMNAWESLFERLIKAVRRKEIHAIQKKNIIYGVLTAVRNTYPATACFLSIAVLWASGINLTPAIVFTISLVLKTLADSVVEAVVEGTYSISLISTTISRLESFLTDKPNGDSRGTPKERPLFYGARGDEKPGNGFKRPGIEMNNVSSQIKAKKDSSMFNLLNGISLQCYGNDLIAITGSAGSGKSSVLAAIIGEIPVSNGEISVTGKIAYMPQNPWLFSGTVRENILFGKEFDEAKYHVTIEACALEDDFVQLPLGDMTYVGESGVALSGGQRARVSLARTVYSDADIFLLDCPLSAVDAKVGELIYEKCICGLLSTRPRIHVTHHKKFLRHASMVIKIEDGCIISRDKLQYEEHENDPQADIEESPKEEIESEVKRGNSKTVLSSGEQGISTAEEDRAIGAVPISTYMKYFNAGAPFLGILLCFLLVFIPGGVNLALVFWLAEFSRKTFRGQQDNDNIYIYAEFQFGLLLSWLLGVFCLLYVTVNCAKHLHNSMLSGILKAPVLFFDTNPAGRILNRFSKDTEFMDEMLPQDIVTTSFFIVDIFFAFLLIGITNYWMIFGYVCLVPAVLLVRYYIRSGVEMKRLEAISASSVYSCVDETISGITIIRNFEREKQFQETLFSLQDKNNKAYMCGVGAARWMAMRLEGIVLLLLAVVIILAVFKTDAATTGITVLCARSVLMGVFRIACLYTYIETDMTSVQRVISYGQLEPNPGYLVEAIPSESWPEEGSIRFEDCSLVYYPGGPQVLKSLCFTTKPGEKIGITGRTGAGKSSLISALFRMPEPDGNIYIDGVPINTLNIQKSRKSMTIVPQQAFLFGGTLRQNLDPEEEHSDKEIWDILEMISLKSVVMEETKDKLNYWITENGSNLSGGEQQLICIARALLQDRKIIVFDEAMASMDFEADQRIQDLLKKELKNRTILTIAHRLDSILDYDRVVVIDEGQIVEVGSPETLLMKEDGQFRRLYEHYRLHTS